MKVSEEKISSIVDKVVDQIVAGKSLGQQGPRKFVHTNEVSFRDNYIGGNSLGCFSTIEQAIVASEKAFLEYRSTTVEKRKEIIKAVRAICHENIEKISKDAEEETGLGRYEDKIHKNLLAIDKTPGVEDLDPLVFTGDHGITLYERCAFGVIGSITPCTNPTETIICNGIGMISGGNTVVFNPHPSAKKVSAFTIQIMNKAVMSVGGPPNLFATVIGPTIESAQILMKHPKVRLLVVTGGPAVVKAAMQSGKRVIAAGPGNPPVVVDDTADLERAGRDIVRSASCDNNIICIVEKEIIVTEKSAAGLKQALIKHGAVEVSGHQLRRLEKVILDKDGHVNRKFIGKDVQVILREIGMNVDKSKRLAIMETRADHPFATTELLMPVVPFIRVKDVDEAIETAYKLEKGCFHTAVIHSKDIDNMHKMAVKMNTSLFVKNGPALAGLAMEGEGPTSFTISSPTGEGLTTARHFTRVRSCVLKGHFGGL